MATKQAVKAPAEKKVISTAMKARAELLATSYNTKRIATLRKKLVTPGSTVGNATLGELKKIFEDLGLHLKKFPNETAGIPVLNDFKTQLDGKLNTFRIKNKTVIANNQKILAEIKLLENTKFPVLLRDEILAYASKNKIVTTSKLTAAVATTVGDKFVAAQVKSLKI